MGKFDEARPAADETVRLRPHDPGLSRCILAKSIADYQTDNYESAAHVAMDSIRSDPQWWLSNTFLAAASGQIGHGISAESTEAIERIRADQPGITLDLVLERVPFTKPEHREHLAAGLERAGWRDRH